MILRVMIVMKTLMNTGMSDRGVHASVCADAIAYTAILYQDCKVLIVFNHIVNQSKDSLCC